MAVQFAAWACMLLPTAGEPVPALEVLGHMDEVRKAYSMGTWTMKINGGGREEDPPMGVRRHRVAYLGKYGTIEFLAVAGNSGRAKVYGPDQYFTAVPGSLGSFALGTVEPPKEFLDNCKMVNGAYPKISTSSPDVAEYALRSPWGGGVTAAGWVKILDEVLAEAPEKRAEKADKWLFAEKMPRGNDQIVRLRTRPIPYFNIPMSFDLRPDLGWVIDRSEYVGPVGARLFASSIGPDSNRQTVREILREELTYEGMLGNVAKLKGIHRSRNSEDAKMVLPQVDFELTYEHPTTAEELTPEHYGIVFKSRGGLWWRWVAGVVGLMGTIAGLWWLRRRAAAS